MDGGSELSNTAALRQSLKVDIAANAWLNASGTLCDGSPAYNCAGK